MGSLCPRKANITDSLAIIAPQQAAERARNGDDLCDPECQGPVDMKVSTVLQIRKHTVTIWERVIEVCPVAM